MSPIKDLLLTYEALNQQNTFSAGDAVRGTVSFTLTEEVKVKNVLVKITGDASVRWSEGIGTRRRSHSESMRYFKVREYLVAENTDGTVLQEGAHSFSFQLTIPQVDMPPSFKGDYGKIVYLAVAKITRSWRLSTVDKKELNFVSKSFTQFSQIHNFGEQVGALSEGHMQIDATIDRELCSPGDTVSIVAKICNSSSKDTRLKCSLVQTVVYQSFTSSRCSELGLCKVVGDPIKASSEKTVSCQLKIPADVIPTTHNCKIIRVDYEVKVYLDISFAFDPEMRFPLVIVPSEFAKLHPVEDVGSCLAVPVGAPSGSDLSPA